MRLNLNNIHRLADRAYKEWYKNFCGNWINSLYEIDDLTQEESLELFLCLLKRFLDDRQAFLRPPFNAPDMENPAYKKTKIYIDEFGDKIEIWDMPSKFMIEYIRSVFPDKVDKDVMFWYDGRCPYIWWPTYDEEYANGADGNEDFKKVWREEIEPNL